MKAKNVVWEELDNSWDSADDDRENYCPRCGEELTEIIEDYYENNSNKHFWCPSCGQKLYTRVGELKH